jgi:diguanylate cyclase (GGDEF)-like protein
MSYRAWAYIWTVLLLGAGLGLPFGGAVTQSSDDWVTFLVLTGLATVAHLFEALGPGRHSYYPSYVFFFAGLLLLPPSLFTLLIVVAHVAEVVKDRVTQSARRRDWYLQPFNIAMHLIAGAGARWVQGWLQTETALLVTPVPMLAATLSALCYVVINNAILGQALVFARNIGWHESGVLELETLMPEFILACLGYVVAILWQINPWFMLPAISPLALMYRALMVPQLKQEAQTDVKTGLSNARHFAKLFGDELARAQRFGRPLTLIMADLDLMRNINNTYGHLAGDAVLAGIGQIIRSTIREYDLAGRFGGEEFAIVLPEVGPHEAVALAERLRAAIADAEFRVESHKEPIGATMSFGVACFPADGTTSTALTHAADRAVYEAKAQGRNRVVAAAEMQPTPTDEPSPDSSAYLNILPPSNTILHTDISPRHAILSTLEQREATSGS